jgi:hypothetical protein
MRKGAGPLLAVLFISVFLAIPILYFFYTQPPANLEGESVKGVRSGEISENGGVSLVVSSSFGTWDLYEYLCVSMDECLSGLMSGKEWSTVSGGTTDGHEVNITFPPTWEEYEYLKVFVLPGWGSSSRSFNVSGSESLIVEPYTYEGGTYSVGLIPLRSEDGAAKGSVFVELSDF